MSDNKKETKIDVKEEVERTSVQTVQEFDELLEKFQKTNPEKYAIKMANGEFDRFRATLLGATPEVKRGRPAKE
jgi:Cft2 family RNA processing exonuclease